eukprot:4772709-Lingulodinium_polyedra.AAC.1
MLRALVIISVHGRRAQPLPFRAGLPLPARWLQHTELLPTTGKGPLCPLGATSTNWEDAAPAAT